MEVSAIIMLGVRIIIVMPTYSSLTLVVYKPTYSMLHKLGNLCLVTRVHALNQFSDLENLQPVACQRHDGCLCPAPRRQRPNDCAHPQVSMFTPQRCCCCGNEYTHALLHFDPSPFCRAVAVLFVCGGIRLAAAGQQTDNALAVYSAEKTLLELPAKASVIREVFERAVLQTPHHDQVLKLLQLHPPGLHLGCRFHHYRHRLSCRSLLLQLARENHARGDVQLALFLPSLPQRDQPFFLLLPGLLLLWRDILLRVEGHHSDDGVWCLLPHFCRSHVTLWALHQKALQYLRHNPCCDSSVLGR